MGYKWRGMRKIPWKKVKEIAKTSGLCGYYYLYDDDTESMITTMDTWDDIVIKEVGNLEKN